MAHEGLAKCHLVLAFYSAGQPRALLEQAKGSAERAVKLDPLNGSARSTIAFLYALADWDWTQAGAGMEKALDLDADDFQVHDWAAFVFAAQGRMREALGEIVTKPSSWTLSRFNYSTTPPGSFCWTASSIVLLSRLARWLNSMPTMHSPTYGWAARCSDCRATRKPKNASALHWICLGEGNRRSRATWVIAWEFQAGSGKRGRF
jgi:hypothetical protein